MQVRMDLEGWRLEDYLAGTYAMHRALRIECQQGEDYDGGESSDEGHEGDAGEEKIDEAVEEPETEPSMVINDGFKWLDYERSDDAVGKW